MFRRSVLQLKNVPLRTKTQVPSYLSSRAFSVSRKNEPHKPRPVPGPGSSNPEQKSNLPNNPEPKSNLPKIITGGIVVGSALLATYYNGYLDKYISKEHQSIGEYNKPQTPEKDTQESSGTSSLHQESEFPKTAATDGLDTSNTSSSTLDHIESNVESHSENSLPEGSVTVEAVRDSQKTDAMAPEQENIDQVEEINSPVIPQSSMPSEDTIVKPAEESFDLKNAEVKLDQEQETAIEAAPITKTTDTMPDEVVTNSVPSEQITTKDVQEDDGAQSSSLLGDYLLKDNSEDIPADTSSKELNVISKREDPIDGYSSKDGVLVLDFLQAIHAAEERQAKIDARTFAEEKRAIKEKYEKEIKDARVRELMYAEREAILDKELTKERVKAAAAIKSLQEKLEEKLKIELEQKEIEVEQTLKKMQDIAKAELAAAIASEKASQIEKMAEANLHINALCMAFYARSEEARQSHSIHKLAIGTLALEDALTKGLPIQKEMEALRTQLEGVDKDSLITLVISSLPEETQECGTDTLSQLNHKFNEMKGTLRRASLIPPGGGGLLTHSLAHIASLLKVKEADQSGDGTESLINKVENLLAQGKLCEAADALENGVKGSQAAEVVDDWVKRARNRAVTEQALTVLQSYATSISLT